VSTAAIRRVLAQALLPASIVPVLILGPGLVHAPEKAWKRLSAEVQRLSENNGGAAGPRRGLEARHGTPASPAARVAAGEPARPVAHVVARGSVRPVAHHLSAGTARRDAKGTARR